MRGHRPVAREYVAERALGRDGGDCVLWPFAIRDGYGVLTSSRPHRRVVWAHRAVLNAAGMSPTAEQTEVRHLCGVRACVNLQHLRWGTRSENQADRFRLHGADHRGSRNANAKVTEEDVMHIRRSNAPYSELALQFGVSTSNIAMIRTGRTWAHLVAVD